MIEEEGHEPPVEPGESAAESPAAADAAARPAPASAPADPEAEGGAEPDAPPQTQCEVWLEVGVVTLVMFFPSYSLALWGWIWSEPAASGVERSSIRSSLGTLSFVLPECLLVLYVICRSGEPWSHFGLKPIRWGQDAFLVLATSFIQYWVPRLATVALVFLLGKDRLGMHGPVPGSRLTHATQFLECAALVLSTLVSAFREELLFRGYLIPRLERLSGSVWISLLLTSVLFASVHFLPLAGFVHMTVVGLVYGAVFCFTRRLWPLVGAHAAHNLWVQFI